MHFEIDIYLENGGRKGLQGIIVASRHVRNKSKGARNTLPCLLNSDAKKKNISWNFFFTFLTKYIKKGEFFGGQESE